VASWFETPRRRAAPHHEGLADLVHEERPLGRVSKDEATVLETRVSTPSWAATSVFRRIWRAAMAQKLQPDACAGARFGRTLDW